MVKNLICLILVSLLLGCKTEHLAQTDEIKIAFMADVHFADVFPNLEEEIFNTLPNIKNNKRALIRTMKAQLHSTRLFNENYFALIAALDDAVKREIKIIVFPGDFSDDGQPLNIKGLNKILNTYAKNYGLSFFFINGNHDPTRPFGDDGGKQDFLGNNGKAQPIMSKEGMFNSNSEFENPGLVLEDLEEWGYQEIVGELANHGFFAKEEYIYWATPFSTYNYEEYNFRKASEASALDDRIFYFKESSTVLPDVSYLVEPVEDLWLLALDANVYLPKEDKSSFIAAGIGYNEVLKHKKYLLEWTQKVVRQANKLGKILIAFSHYPMVEFNDGASEDLKNLFGVDAFQAHRIPNKIVGETFANMGLKLHVAGHMHLNDTGLITTKNGHTLVNIQTPSLAGYLPAYKVITRKKQNRLDVQTIVLDTVPGFDSFFTLYEKEHEFLKVNGDKQLWNKEILLSKNYLEFTEWHLKELIRLRFLSTDWSKELTELVINSTGWELLLLSNLKREMLESELDTNGIDSLVFNFSEITSENIEEELQKEGLTKDDFINWKGEDLIFDFYRFRNGDQLALHLVDARRIKAYEMLANAVNENTQNERLTSLRYLMIIVLKQMHGEPSVNFSIDIENGGFYKN